MNMILDLQIDNVVVIIKVLIYIIFLISAGFFASIETALLKYSAKKFEIKNESIIKYISLWETKPEIVLGTILLGTNLICIGIGVLTKSLGIWIGYSTLLLLVLGEIFPKIFALNHPQKIINYFIKKLFFFSKFLYPISKFLVNISMYFINIFLGEKQESFFVSAEELKQLVYSVDNTSKEEKMIYSNMLELTEKRVYDVMTPKEDIIAVDGNSSLDEIIEKLNNVKYSRIPVYKGNIDNIIGIIYTKDIILAMQNKEILVLEDLLRGPYFVINTAKVIDVLKKFKQGQHHMGIVVDEYGSTVGLVTIEDIIEEIVGEIYDEYDIKEEKIKFVNKNIIVVNGDESIKNIEEIFDIKFEDEEVVTIGGYIMTKLGYVPNITEKFEIHNLKIEILDATDKFIKKIKLEKKL
ncbi:MAG: hemolysin family protein [Endomicrobiia bacterium]